MANNKLLRIPVGRGYQEKQDIVPILLIAMSHKEFDPTMFIIGLGKESYKQVTWIAKDKGGKFESSLESKIESTVYVLISKSNNINSFSYDLSHSLSFECFASNNHV